MKVDKAHIINELMKYKNVASKADFARFLEITPQGLATWLSRNTFDINKIESKFPEVSEVWLMTGEGEMLKTDTPKADPMRSAPDMVAMPREVLELLLSQQKTIEGQVQAMNSQLQAINGQVEVMGGQAKVLDSQQQTIAELSKKGGNVDNAKVVAG